MRYTTRALAALVLLPVLAGCGTIEATAPQPGSFTAPPLPARADPSPSLSALPATPNCGDVTAGPRPSRAGGPALDAVRARGRLLVGLDPGSNLFSFRDPISGSLTGFDVDVAREIARDVFGDPDKIEYRILNSGDREKALQSHAVDVVVKTMTMTCQRRTEVAFSTTYLMAHQRVLALRSSGINGIGDLAGKRVCVVDGTTSLDLLRRVQPAAAVLTVPTWADCLVVLQQQQAAAITTDDAVLAGLAVQDPYTEVVGDNLSNEPYGVGVPKDNDDMVRFVNATLERIRSDGTWNRLYQHWLADALGPASGPPPPDYQD
ncbi:glutamate ABC transporter substrate-binding protein [Nocardia stercoris]|uniref:Glutamate ABC transporter substrate-binding protein n=1 Tax=Nocardia stercoris TaxID=2483361 RepID=A0A3M2KWN2_9NOCA|nr:glutamate ABC transporter substrate-binding protein [Nocardia stercoris]RMI28663.1 glutamate ABC transporter substrate-binding protein [Nocardia stercoris]